MKPIIRVENLGKQYRIGRREAPYATLRESLTRAARAPFDRLRRGFRHSGPGSPESNGNGELATDVRESDGFWALRDVSFEVQPGEVIGIIGRNGAGKSTLLKVLSRVTEPTRGKVDLYGRVGSLLEVGTGFHPELTGRENVFLNGAILGIRRREIARNFDAIVDFAEIERFIDTPVKRYSSGMYMRLAFAVAAHLEPEILIVDEVLAVGDQAFQKKCLGKMGDVASQEGRTILFVSHNVAAIRGLCHRAVMLEGGRLILEGPADEVIRRYLDEMSNSRIRKASWFYRHRSSDIAVESVELRVNDLPTRIVQAGSPCTFRICYKTLNEHSVGSAISVSLMLFVNGQKLVNLWTNYYKICSFKTGRRGYLDCSIPRWPFRSHEVRVDVFMHSGPKIHDWIEESCKFESYDGDYYGSGVVTDPEQGIMFLEHGWHNHADE